MGIWDIWRIFVQQLNNCETSGFRFGPRDLHIGIQRNKLQNSINNELVRPIIKLFRDKYVVFVGRWSRFVMRFVVLCGRGDPPNRGRLPICVKSSHIWEAFPHLGRLPIYRKTSHKWEVSPYMGSLPVYGHTSHIWEDFAYMGWLPIHGMTSHVWEDFPCVGRLPFTCT